jgi:hypothetical protein
LKSTQRDKVKRFVSFTQTTESTAIFCLSQHDWKLELASDAYFQNPDLYWRESSSSTSSSKAHPAQQQSQSHPHNHHHHQHTQSMADRKKVDALFNKYRGKMRIIPRI